VPYTYTSRTFIYTLHETSQSLLNLKMWAYLHISFREIGLCFDLNVVIIFKLNFPSSLISPALFCMPPSSIPVNQPRLVSSSLSSWKFAMCRFIASLLLQEREMTKKLFLVCSRRMGNHSWLITAVFKIEQSSLRILILKLEFWFVLGIGIILLNFQDSIYGHWLCNHITIGSMYPSTSNILTSVSDKMLSKTSTIPHDSSRIMPVLTMRHGKNRRNRVWTCRSDVWQN